MSKKKIEIGLGENPTEEQAKGEAVKAQKVGEANKDQEIEGHVRYIETVVCPRCGGYNDIVADTDRVILFECAYSPVVGYHTFTY